MPVLDFLRDVGKHVTVNQMMAKESVRSRIESEHGISYTEFSYMLLQANDFRWLCEHRDVELQMGGSDQWGNITAGIDLIRRVLGPRCSRPDLAAADAARRGEDGQVRRRRGVARSGQDDAVPFRQFWVQATDDEVAGYLRRLSLRPLDEVEDLVAEHEKAPERRLAQRALADELTALVHGREAAAAAAEAAGVLFGADPLRASPEAFAVVRREVGVTTVPADVLGDVVAVLARTPLASSNGDARRTLAQRGYRVNGQVLDESTTSLADVPRVEGRYLVLRRGKTSYHVVECASQG